MFKLKFKGRLRDGLSGALFLMIVSASSSLFAQTLPALGDTLPNVSELAGIGFVVGGNLLQSTPLENTLLVPSVAVVLGDTVIGVTTLPVSAPAGPSVLEFVDPSALPL